MDVAIANKYEQTGQLQVLRDEKTISTLVF